jgi:hypothetical protein
MGWQVGCCRRMARGTRGSRGSRVRAGSCRSVGGNRGGARRSAPYLSAHPGTRCFDGPARPVISRALSLEVWKHMLCTQGRPQRKGTLIKSIQSAGILSDGGVSRLIGWWLSGFGHCGDGVGLLPNKRAHSRRAPGIRYANRAPTRRRVQRDS